ncbi:hypothetical protein LIER_28679 [Lithospermum erythrorhizon]|uniref:Pentatricopeptide repeat-containing protein n=1 Tax=Lithospermum erythrorhizon TaxID=34254 RepID=A0AAV3RK26_LITER
MKQFSSQCLKTILTKVETTIILRNNSYSTRLYYTNPKKNKKETLYSKISPLGDPKTTLSPVLDEWLQSTPNKPAFAELKRIILDLRKRKRFSQALQVSEWMQKQGLYTFTSVEHAVQLDLIGKVHGFGSAETYFNNLSDHEKNEKTNGALLHCYVRQDQIEKSLTHLEKMKEKGLALSSVTFNDIMCLYTNNNRGEEVLNVFTHMKTHGISPDNLSYRLCINAYEQRSEMEGMDKIFEEMESRSDFVIDWNTYTIAANYYIKAGLHYKARNALIKAEEKLDSKDAEGYNHLISLHAKLGNKKDVFRIWELEKIACRRCVNKDYIVMLESLVKLGEVEEAEKMLVDWESSGNIHDFRVPNIVILGYIAKGLYEKAEMILEELVNKGIQTKPDSWAKLVSGYLDNDEVKNAVECMKAALSLCKISKSWKPYLKTITRILDSTVKEGNFEDLQMLIHSLRNVSPLNRQSYLSLLESCIKNGKEVDVILENMRIDKVVQDEETELILSKKVMLEA